MGIFDFLKPKKPPAPPGLPDDDGPSFRYMLAHYALRQTALDAPLQYLAILASPDARRFIGVIMVSVTEHLGRPPDFTVDAVKVHPVRVKDYPCAIVEMPEPREIAEAHFTGLVVLLKPVDDLPQDPKDLSARYFTLEKGCTLDGAPRTVLAEWDQTSHSNYGDGPSPTVEAFARAIGDFL